MASSIPKIVAVCCLLFASFVFSQKPWDSIPRNEASWMQKHEQFLNTTGSQGSSINIVFIGSSSVANWGSTGSAIWNAKYAPLGAINYGIGGDKTENVIWRIDNGELDGLNPKLVVAYIGANNVPAYPNNTEVVMGMDTVIDRIHGKVPNASILFLGIFPRGDRSPISATLNRIVNISAIFEPMVDGDTERRSYWLDIFDSLAPPTLDSIYEEYYSGDKLHFNADGYVLWDQLMNSTFYSLLQ